MRTRLLTMTLLVLTALAMMAAPLQAKPPSGDPDVARTLAQVRQATAKYHDVDAAEEAGYGQVTGCIPNMGIHYSRGAAEDHEALDPLHPEMLVYAHGPDDTLRLVAVEYAVDASAEHPSLFGQVFAEPAPPGTPGPEDYTLHAWVWQGNPAGIFSPMNPNIRC